MNAKELSQRMASDADRIAEYLLPAGKRKGKEWKAGSASGEEGDSLSVCVAGAKAGVWSDFASGEKGDLLDLWMAVRGNTLIDAMSDAQAYLGVRDSMPANQPKPKTYRVPDRPMAQAAKDRVADWLTGPAPHGRCLTGETVAAFRIAEQKRNGQSFAVFPFLREDGSLVNVKYRNVDDKKQMRQEAEAEPILFGWHLIDAKARSVAITEGEIDAMTLHQIGVPALSVNQGAGNHQWIERDWTRLERFSDILIFFDNDEAGEKGAREVIQRLGADRCRRVVLPGAKDANAYLQAGAERVDFIAAIDAARPMDPEELRAISDFIPDVVQSFYPPHDGPAFPRLRLDVDLEWFEFRGGEVTLWTGINGHGKSLLLSQVVLGLLQQDEMFTIFSGELMPVKQLKRMMKQATGLDRPTKEYIVAVGAWLHGRCWVFNQIGMAKLDRLLEVFTYAHRRYGSTHFVIDSLMTTDVPDDGAGAFTQQKAAIAKLCGFAKQYGVHVHLVAHPRKGRDEGSSPGKMDVAGSGHLTNGVDNIFSVWKAQKDESQPDVSGDMDARLELIKQREDGVQNFRLALWFNKASMQYRTTQRARQFSYVPFSNQEHHDESVHH